MDSDLDRAPGGLPVPGALEDGLLVVDGDRKILWCNPALARMLGLPPGEVPGTDLLSLLEEHLLPAIEDEASARSIRQTLLDGADLPDLCCRTRSPAGTRRWLSIAGSRIPGGQHLIRIRDAARDIDAHHFRTALKQSPVVVFAQDLDLRYIWSCNQQLGPTDESIIGARDEEIFPDGGAHFTAIKRWILETGEGMRTSMTLNVDGDHHVRDLTLKPLRDAEGRIAGITGTAFDVTERDRAEKALQKRMSELQCLYAITHLVEVPGITPDGLLQAVADTLPSGWQYPDDAAVRIQIDDREYRRGEPKETPWRQASPIIVCGERRGEVEIWYTSEKPEAVEGPFLTEERMLLDAVAERLGRIIERLQIEAALRESEAKFRGIAQRSFDLIATSYLDGGLNYISPAMERILGYSPAEMKGTDWEDYILPVSLPVWEEGRQRMLQNRQVEGLQIEVRQKNGETAVLELNGSPIVEKGAIVGFQAVGRDISERVLYERLREQTLDLNARNIAQFAILADHVRHPLQVVLGLADLLDDEKTAEILREQVRRINARISELDREWVESRKIREFLKRYEL